MKNASKPLLLDWLDHRFAHSRDINQQLKRNSIHKTVMTWALAPAAGILIYIYFFSVHEWLSNLCSTSVITALATLASSVTAAGICPILYRKHAQFSEAISRLAHSHIEWLTLLGKLIELRDPETNGHNHRVTLYTLMFCEYLKLDSWTIARIVEGAFLHDIGKLAVSDFVLGKPGLLNAAERKTMQQHVRYGVDILEQADVFQGAVALVAAHHEWYDGNGYPLGIHGENIPYEARVFALVDVFDALITRRRYKPAFSVQDALKIMQGERGTHFDPALLDSFVLLVPEIAEELARKDTEPESLFRERIRPYLFYFIELEFTFLETSL